MQARFYAPWYGRFLSPDPAGDQHFEETQSWNIYSYVQNNPTMNIDPTGMYSWNVFKDDVKAVVNKVVDKWKADAKVVANDPNAQAMARNINSLLLIPTVPGASGAPSVPTPGPALATPEGIVVQGGATALPAAIPNPAAAAMTGGNGEGSGKSDHAQQRADEAKAGDTHRQVGDPNRTVQEGRVFTDSTNGNKVYVRGDKVVIRTAEGEPVTQFKNSRANTQQRIRSGKWVPE